MPLASKVWAALGGEPGTDLSQEGDETLPSVHAVTDLAVATIGAAGRAIAELTAALFGDEPQVVVDRRLASLWFGRSFEPIGWELAPTWDAVAGDYRTSDGWVKLHTNAPAHRRAALGVLGVPVNRGAVERAVARWRAEDLETAVVEAGGCAAAMRSAAFWREHPQGMAVAAEPLVRFEDTDRVKRPVWPGTRERPLQGLRVLDVTRVLAGPVATRFLAGFGAEVLRIDPPWWDEPAIAPDVTLGKRCARLDLRREEEFATLEKLLADADVIVHGYRPGALEGLGFGAERRRQLRPGLVDVSLCAYGWTGPWRGRRGFDSLVQMSSGIAEAGMRASGFDRPVPLPVQALDHACGYLMAAAVLRGLTQRVSCGVGCEARASLARVAAVLATTRGDIRGPGLAPANEQDWAEGIENTAGGPARRLRAPVTVGTAVPRWDRGAGPLGTAAPAWASH
ncbi:MAG: CoA transferase [Janthinobacterium lividum]